MKKDNENLLESERSWKEDFHLENGPYICHCVQCNNMFMGYKRRIVCKTCALENSKRRY